MGARWQEDRFLALLLRAMQQPTLCEKRGTGAGAGTRRSLHDSTGVDTQRAILDRLCAREVRECELPHCVDSGGRQPTRDPAPYRGQHRLFVARWAASCLRCSQSTETGKAYWQLSS